jgi:magnesium transporter
MGRFFVSVAISGNIQSHFQQPVREFIREDFATLRQDLTVAGALDAIRREGLGDRIIYFYVVDEDRRLMGVLPTRRLLTEPLEKPIAEIMIKRVIAVPESATLLDACEFFILYKFYALPVVDASRRIIGVVDVGLFTEEVLNVEERGKVDDVFQAIGFRVGELRNATPLKAFRLRFPWLLATISGGTLCALLTGAFAGTVEERIVLAFFMTLVLGLGESVSAQSMAVTLHALHSASPSWRWLWRALRREVAIAALLGSGAGGIVAIIVLGWRREGDAALAIGASIFASVMTACLLGVAIPALLRALRLDPRIASGPLTLALADICTLACYFGLAALIL